MAKVLRKMRKNMTSTHWQRAACMWRCWNPSEKSAPGELRLRYENERLQQMKREYSLLKSVLKQPMQLLLKIFRSLHFCTLYCVVKAKWIKLPFLSINLHKNRNKVKRFVECCVNLLKTPISHLQVFRPFIQYNVKAHLASQLWAFGLIIKLLTPGVYQFIPFFLAEMSVNCHLQLKQMFNGVKVWTLVGPCKDCQRPVWKPLQCSLGFLS